MAPEMAFPAGKITGIIPTLYFVREQGELKQRVTVSLITLGPGFFVLRITGPGWRGDTPLGELPAGETQADIYLPDVRVACQMSFILWRVGGEAEGAPLVMEWKPVRHWHVYLIPSAHLDIGYTDLPTESLAEYLDDFDRLLQFCRTTNDWPSDAKYRYVIEQAWLLSYYLRHSGADKRDAMLALIREGRVEVNAFCGNMVTEIMGSEEMVRMVSDAMDLRRRYGIPITTAEHNDVPGMSWSLVTLMARAGVRYFCPGLPDYYRWGHRVHAFWDEDRVQPGGVPAAFHWEGPAGERILTYIHSQGAGGETHPGLPNLEAHLADLDAKGYPYPCLRYQVKGAVRDNSPVRFQFAETVREWNKRWVFPRLIMATNRMFFQHLEETLGSTLPVLRGELPGADYPIGAMSTAHATVHNRVAQELLPTAERFAALATALCEAPFPAAAIRKAYKHLLRYDEHTWGVAYPNGPAQEAALQEKTVHAFRAHALAQDIFTKAANVIADDIYRAEDGHYVAVFNPRPWPVTDVVELPLRPPDPASRPCGAKERGNDGRLWGLPCWGREMGRLDISFISKPFRVVRSDNGDTMPHQLERLWSANAPGAFAPQRFSMGQWDPSELWTLHFIARDVPAFGYALYRLEAADTETPVPSGMTARPERLETPLFRIAYDVENRSILSVFDKIQGRDLLDPAAPFRLGQVVARWVATGEDQTGRALAMEPGEPGPVFVSMRLQGRAPGCPVWTQEVRLYAELPRVDIQTRILRDADASRDIYLAFPFREKAPIRRYDTPFCVIEYLRDQFPGSNSENLTVRHWVSSGGMLVAGTSTPVYVPGALGPGYVSQAHHGVTPPGFGRPFAASTAEVPLGHLYALLAGNNFRTNFHPMQPGSSAYRHMISVLPPGAGDDVAARLGEAAASPLMAFHIEGRSPGALPPAFPGVILTPPDAGVTLLTVKYAEDAPALILRLLETRGKGARVRLTLPWWNIHRALSAALDESPIEPLPSSRSSLEARLGPWDLVTIRLEGAAALESEAGEDEED